MDLDLSLPRQSKRQTCSKRMSLVTFNELYKVLHSANPEMNLRKRTKKIQIARSTVKWLVCSTMQRFTLGFLFQEHLKMWHSDSSTTQ